MGARAHAYRFFKASLQILHLDFLLKREVADGVPLLGELAPEVLTVKNNGLRYHPVFGGGDYLTFVPHAFEFGSPVVGDRSLLNVRGHCAFSGRWP